MVPIPVSLAFLKLTRELNHWNNCAGLFNATDKKMVHHLEIFAIRFPLFLHEAN